MVLKWTCPVIEGSTSIGYTATTTTLVLINPFEAVELERVP